MKTEIFKVINTLFWQRKLLAWLVEIWLIDFHGMPVCLGLSYA